ncbi:hypothetical protein ACHAXR_012852 [Thalassiosira sp. AJA248-18]
MPVYYSKDNVSMCVKDCDEYSGQTTHSTLWGCCEQHHNWTSGPGNYNQCMGITNPPTTRPTTNPPTTRPTKSLTRTPTLRPTSRSPSKSPSTSPTTRPTNPPTRSPTLRPTSRSPSKSPSTSPTTSPTSSFPPTQTPTASPSRAPIPPTLKPTDAPSKRPSQTPSRAPTSNPTDAPSKIPSKGPSIAPTSNPTDAPSKRPSKSPSSAANKIPIQFISLQLTPTLSLHRCPSVYYSNDITCVNDCKQSDGDWNRQTFGTRQECCSARHGYLGVGGYDQCMSSTNTPTISPPPTAPPVPCLFYNIWALRTCVDDCNPTEVWVGTYYGTLDACCAAEYTWEGAYEACVGITKEPTPAPPAETDLFYVDWTASKCVQNCDKSFGGACGGINRDTLKVKWNDVQTCCKEELPYKCPFPDIPCEECTDADVSPWAQTLYYVDWDSGGKCVENCDPSTGPHCMGAPQAWQEPHTDLATCCEVHLECPNSVFPCDACTDVPF